MTAFSESGSVPTVGFQFMKWIRISEPIGRGFNLKRKIYHMAGLLVPVMLYCDVFRFLSDDPFITRKVLIGLLVAANIALIVMETLRMKHSGFRDLFHRLFGSLMKESERDRIHGTVAYMISNLVLVLFFSDEVVVLSLTFLVLADPLAAFVGIYYGRLRFWNGKSVEGMLAFVAGSFLSGIVFYLIQDALNRGNLPFVLESGSIGVALAVLGFAAVVAALAEFFSFTALNGVVDDNLIVPLAAAAAFVIAALSLGFLPATVFFDVNWML